MEFPGKDRIRNPLVDLYYEVNIRAKPEHVWPWIKQVGYHRAGWYIDTWWDTFSQEYFRPRVVPIKPFFILIDGAQQRQILQGVKIRVEKESTSQTHIVQDRG